MEYGKKTLIQRIRKNFFTGVITLLPLAITLLFLYWIVDFIHTKLNFIPQRLFPHNDLLITLFEIILFVLLFLVICLMGVLTNHYIGKKLIQTGDSILNRIPLLRTVYSGTKQILETFTTGSKRSFKQVVMVQFPRKGCWCMGFITGELDFIRLKKKNMKLITVFIPTTPNPTTGYLFLMPARDIVSVGMSVETAFKLIVSGGILSSTMHLKEIRN